MSDAIDLERLAGHHERIRRLARALVRSEQEAEDLVQDAWVRAIERGPRDAGALGAWLATVVRRLAANSRRGAQRRDSRERDVARPEALPSSEEIAARVDVEAKLLAALESLDEPHRTVLRDRYLGGLEVSDIAARDSLSESAVRSRLKRARAALREKLERDGLESDVHWTSAIAPLVLAAPAGGSLLPGGETLIGAGSSNAVAIPTMLVGSIIAMKKLAVVIVVAALGVLAWHTMEAEPLAEPIVTLGESESPEVVDLGLNASETAQDAPQLVAPDALPDSVARSLAVEPVSAGPQLLVTGCFRGGPADGIPGVAFQLAMYAGLEIDGDPLERFPLTSDAEGRFSLKLERPTQSVCFDVEVDEHPMRFYQAYAPYRAALGREEVDIDILVLVRDATVTGRVIDAEGRPVVGAHVEGKAGAGRTSGDGTFQLLVAAKSYGGVTAWADGHGHAKAFIDELEPGGTAHVELRLPPEVIVTGVVRDARGVPVSGAEIEAFGHAIGETRSDAAGRYRLRAIPHKPGANLSVSAKTDVHFAESRDCEITADRREYEMDFELTRGILIRGQVLDPDGAAVAGAEVWAGWDPHAWDRVVVYSSDDGTFELDGAPNGLTHIGAKRDGWPSLDREAELSDGGSVTLRFERPRALRGVVRDEAGAPIAGIALSAKRDEGYLDESTRSDVDGRFELDGFPGQGRLALEAFGSGWVRVEVPVPQEAFRDESDEFVVVMAAAGVLSGRVTDAATGLPLTGFTVRIGWPQWPGGRPEGAQAIDGVTSSWNRPGRTFMAEDGRWSTGEHDELRPGRWAAIEVSAPGYAALRMDAVKVAPLNAALDVAFALSRPVTAQVTVTSADEPLSGVRVVGSSVRNPSGADTVWVAGTGAAGVTLLEGVSPGPLYLRLEREGRVDWRAGPFEISRAAPALEIELPPGCPVEITVRTAAGDASAGDRVMLVGLDALGATEMTMMATTGGDGRLRFDDVPPGTWRVARAVGDERFPEADLPLEITVAPGGEPIAIVLEPDGRARVTLKFEGERVPPDGTLVQLISETQRARAGEIQGGQLVLAGVAVGAYRVEGYYQDLGLGGTLQLRGTVEVASGALQVDAAGLVER